jgi:hypothetical protein
MKMSSQNIFIALALLALATLNSQFSTARAQGTTAFTYQGQLRDGGTNANGTYTMIFALYDSASGGNQIGSAITTSPTLANGLFTVNLDFGAGAFDGSARWLDITVQSGSDNEELTPRVQVLPAPYAIFANVAGTASNLDGILPASQLTNTLLSAQLGGTYSNAVTINNTNNSFDGVFSGNGGGLINLNASQLTSGTVPNGRLSGTYSSAVNFNNSANNFSGTFNGDFTGDGNGLYDLEATNLIDEIPDDLLSSNVAFLNYDQTFDGQNTFNDDVTFNQDIIMDEWNIGISDYKGYSVLSFSQNDSYRMIIAPAGIPSSSGDGTDAGMEIFDSLGVDGDEEITDNLIVEGTIYGNVNTNSVVATAAEITANAANGQEILNRVAHLNISSWNSKQDAKQTVSRHIGPNAHDFNTTFGFGNSDRLISLVDEEGVTLAAIQALNQKLNEKDAQIGALEKRLTELEAQVKSSATK